jgi:hypothetical protein
LQLGSVIPVGAVRCALGVGRFVWFGWENYDTTSTGLGRLDVTVINTDAPAYASDLMATGQGHVLSIAQQAGSVAFTVSALGVYAQSTDLVPSGSLDTGIVTFDLPDPKVAQYIDIRHQLPLAGTHAVSLSSDEGVFALLGTHSAVTPEAVFSARDSKAEVYELRHTLTRDTVTTTGPVLNRWMLAAIPAARSGEQINVPLLLRGYDSTDSGATYPRSPVDDLVFLKALRASKQSFAYQEGRTTYKGIMQDYTWIPAQLLTDRSGFGGTFVAQILVQAVN